MVVKDFIGLKDGSIIVDFCIIYLHVLSVNKAYPSNRKIFFQIRIKKINSKFFGFFNDWKLYNGRR